MSYESATDGGFWGEAPGRYEMIIVVREGRGSDRAGPEVVLHRGLLERCRREGGSHVETRRKTRSRLVWSLHAAEKEGAGGVEG